MGLRFPTDLDAWQRWQVQRRPVRSTARAIGDRLRPRPADSSPVFVARRDARPAEVVAVLESRAASSRTAVLEPLKHVEDLACGVIAPFDPVEFLPAGWRSECVGDPDFKRLFPQVAAVISAAHYLPLGSAAYADARSRGHLYVTVQHGLLTPLAPPLPPETPVLVWSDADATFWLSGRSDAEAFIVGSQLLWSAAQRSAGHVSRFDRPVFLGQLHAAELSRAGMVKAVTEFCRETGALYRPHPSETDKLSTAQHRLWQRLGIEMDRSGRPLDRLRAPVVSIFSTGLLEASAQGVPAWAHHPNPPAWLTEFWGRYGLARWGGLPSATPAQAAVEPANAVAAWLRGRL